MRNASSGKQSLSVSAVHISLALQACLRLAHEPPLKLDNEAISRSLLLRMTSSRFIAGRSKQSCCLAVIYDASIYWYLYPRTGASPSCHWVRWGWGALPGQVAGTATIKKSHSHSKVNLMKLLKCKKRPEDRREVTKQNTSRRFLPHL